MNDFIAETGRYRCLKLEMRNGTFFKLEIESRVFPNQRSADDGNVASGVRYSFLANLMDRNFPIKMEFVKKKYPANE